MVRAVGFQFIWLGFASIACGGEPRETKETAGFDSGFEAASGGSTGGQASGGGGVGAQSGGSAGSGVEIDGGEIDGGACGPNVPFNPPNATCNSCVLENCCAQKQACGANPECVALRQCGGKPGCSSGPCWEQCLAAYPNGVSDADALAACLVNECNVQCELAPPLPCGLELGLSASCQKCAEDSCCGELSAANRTQDFWDWYACTEACGPYNPFDTTCLDQCAGDHPTGAEQWQAIAACYNSSCQGQC